MAVRSVNCETIPLAEPESLELFAPARSVAGRDLTGGTAPAQVAAQLAFWTSRLGIPD